MLHFSGFALKQSGRDDNAIWGWGGGWGGGRGGEVVHDGCTNDYLTYA